jgi:hypothetical protein
VAIVAAGRGTLSFFSRVILLISSFFFTFGDAVLLVTVPIYFLFIVGVSVVQGLYCSPFRFMALFIILDWILIGFIFLSIIGVLLLTTSVLNIKLAFN